MIKFSKRFSALAVALFMIICTPICVFAESEYKIIDEAQLLTESELSDINTQLESVSQETGWDVAVYTNNNNVDKSDMKDYCNKYYKENNYGKNSDKRGMLLTIDMSSRHLYIITKGDTMYYFNDERNDKILDDVQADMKRNDYYGALQTYVTEVEQSYSEGKPTDGTFSNLTLAEKDANPLLYVLRHYGIIIAAISLILAFIIVIIINSKYKNNGKKGTYNLGENSKTNLTEKEDIFIDKHVSVTTINTDSSSSGGDSGGDSDSCGGGGRDF